jgi:hypothetical protein
METAQIDEARARQRAASRRFLERFSPGRASKFIFPFNLSPGDKVVLVVRKSSPDQGPIEAQEQFLREAAEKAEARILKVFRYEGSGNTPIGYGK